jgi:uncharacterized membrane-anchored protein
MTFSDAVPNIVGVLALVFYLAGLAGIVWAFYIAYLLTRALRKYLRS